MSTRFLITHSLLWAAAILASATVGAPAFLTLILLPSLAFGALLAAHRPPAAGAAARRRCYTFHLQRPRRGSKLDAGRPD